MYVSYVKEQIEYKCTTNTTIEATAKIIYTRTYLCIKIVRHEQVCKPTVRYVHEYVNAR